MINRSIIKNVTATEDAIFIVLGTNPYGMSLFLHNIGANTITFKFQKALENIEASYIDLVPDVDGYSALSGNLAIGDVVSNLIITSYPYIRLLASSAGASVLHSSVNQFTKSTSDILPILNI